MTRARYTGVKYVGMLWWDSWQFVITKIANYFAWMIEGVLTGLAEVLDAFNSIAPEALQIDTSSLKEAALGAKLFQDMGNKDIADASKRRDHVLLDGERANAGYDKEIKDAFLKDPQSGNKAFDFDSSKLKAGFKHLGDGIWGSLLSGLDTVKVALPKPGGGKTTPNMFGPRDTGKAPGLPQMEKGSVVGTFNANSFGQLGTGGSVMERTAIAAEKIARNTDPNNGGVGTL